MCAVVLRDEGFAGVCGINRFDDVEGRLEFEIGLSHGEAPLEQGHHDGGGRGRARPRLRRARPPNVSSRWSIRATFPSVRVAEKVGMASRQAGAIPRHGPALLLHQPRRLGQRPRGRVAAHQRLWLTGIDPC